MEDRLQAGPSRGTIDRPSPVAVVRAVCDDSLFGAILGGRIVPGNCHQCNALVWNRNNRPPFLCFARENGGILFSTLPPLGVIVLAMSAARMAQNFEFGHAEV